MHEERLRHANLGLDTRLYGLEANTTSSDLLRAGRSFLCLEGPWFYNRVSSSLVSYLMGNEEFVAKDLQELKDKAVTPLRASMLAEKVRSSNHGWIANASRHF